MRPDTCIFNPSEPKQEVRHIFLKNIIKPTSYRSSNIEWLESRVFIPRAQSLLVYALFYPAFGPIRELYTLFHFITVDGTSAMRILGMYVSSERLSGGIPGKPDNTEVHIPFVVSAYSTTSKSDSLRNLRVISVSKQPKLHTKE